VVSSQLRGNASVLGTYSLPGIQALSIQKRRACFSLRVRKFRVVFPLVVNGFTDMACPTRLSSIRV
jgi:hypothetical protein